jgi:hypothetical protein
MTRPLSDLPRAVAAMGKAAAEVKYETVGPMTAAVTNIVRVNGRRHYIRGRGGAKVELGVRSNVRGFGRSRVEVGKVEGVPAGFWRIVEEGSSRHIIAGRYKRSAGIGPRQKSSNTRRSVFRILDSDSTFGRSSPINVPGIGYRQFVDHPGHGSQGRPWAKSMRQAEPVAQRELEKAATKTFTKAWTGR